MDVIGAQEIVEEQKVGSNWYPYWTHSVENYPEFYDYNTFTKSGTFFFNGRHHLPRGYDRLRRKERRLGHRRSHHYRQGLPIN